MRDEPASTTPDMSSEGSSDHASAETSLVAQGLPQADAYDSGGVAGPPVPTVHDANETPSLTT